MSCRKAKSVDDRHDTVCTPCSNVREERRINVATGEAEGS